MSDDLPKSVIKQRHKQLKRLYREFIAESERQERLLLEAEKLIAALLIRQKTQTKK
jgi:hypothetical protein